MIAISRTPKSPGSRRASTASQDEHSPLLQQPSDQIIYDTLPDQENGTASPPSPTTANPQTYNGTNDDHESSTGSDTLVEAENPLHAVRGGLKNALNTTLASTKRAPAAVGAAAKRTPCLLLLTSTWRTLLILTCLTLIYILPVLSWRILKRLILIFQIDMSEKDILAGERVWELLGAGMQAFFSVMLYTLWREGKKGRGEREREFGGLVWEALRIAVGLEAGFGVAFAGVVVLVWGWKGLDVGPGHALQ